MFVAILALGEGWHNYHHAFPWDYRASELGSPVNLTGFLIDVLANIGFVYDRKEATHNMVKNRVLRTGDDSHQVYGSEEGHRAFTTLFNIWKHPSNPTYNSLFSPKPKIINSNGYALEQKELNRKEIDEDLLSQENAEMEKLKLEVDSENNENKQNGLLNNYIVDKTEQSSLVQHYSSTQKDSECNNNNNVTNASVAKNKSDLNINIDEVFLVKL